MSEQKRPASISVENKLRAWIVVGMLFGANAAALLGQSEPERKNEKYIIRAKDSETPQQQINASRALMDVLARLDNKIIPGAPRMAIGWHQARPKSDNPVPQVPTGHVHDHTEILGYFGSDQGNPQNLRGEIELWLEDEKYLLRESCIVYIPKGIKHGPIIIHYLDKAILHIALNLDD